MTNAASPSVARPASRCLGSGFEESAERGPNLRNHVSGGGGAAVLLESLVAALACERACAQGGQEQRAGPRGRTVRQAPLSLPRPPDTPNRFKPAGPLRQKAAL